MRKRESERERERERDREREGGISGSWLRFFFLGNVAFLILNFLSYREFKIV